MLLSKLPREEALEHRRCSVLPQAPGRAAGSVQRGPAGAAGNVARLRRPRRPTAHDHAGWRTILQLLADKTAATFSGLSRALDALASFVTDPTRRVPRRRGVRRPEILDWLPAIVNGGRALVTVASMALFWIVTAWPGGDQAIVFAAIISILLAPRADQAYGVALIFVGIVLDLVLTAIVNFAVLLLGIEDLAGLSIVLAFAWCRSAPCWCARESPGRSACLRR